jgi:Planctomycete cytochrome C/WD domain, G-beta repeat
MIGEERNSHALHVFSLFLLVFCLHGIARGQNQADGARSKSPTPVSYYKDIRPILQRSCQGCHQPATKSGGLLLTSYDAFMAGGDKGKVLIPGQPGKSLLIAYLTGEAKPQMPFGGSPLAAEQIALFRRWIAEGAPDDSPPVTKETVAAGKLPVYHQPPVITSLAYSPNGGLLAVSGYREIVLHKADGSGILARLACLSDKITSLAFSPDGSILAAAGGTPAMFGEVQFWDVAQRKLKHSVTLTNDTLFGVSFSPDGRQVAFGAADNSIYLFDVASGTQVRKITDHDGWVFGTVFSQDGSQIVSVSRDRAVKLTDVAQGVFIENINQLKGELLCIARQPKHDNVVVGGEDGVPALYMMHRLRSLVIGDTSTLIREFEKQDGPVVSLAFSSDGQKIAVGGGAEEIRTYDVATGKRLASFKDFEGGIYALTFSPGGQQLTAAGFDGKVRIYDLKAEKLTKAFVPVPLEKQQVSMADKY